MMKIDLENIPGGYVELVHKSGDEITIVNAARASFDKQSDWIYDDPGQGFSVKTRMKKSDQRLLKFLAAHRHWTPFSHVTLTFRIRAPEMVFRQWRTHAIGSSPMIDPIESWNVMSGRYVTEDWEFYSPKWRSAPDNKKQGSSGFIEDEETIAWLNVMFTAISEEGSHYYEQALEMGVAPEQARVFLPAYAQFITWFWTCSYYRVASFLNLRLKEDAQWEIREFSKAVRDIVEPEFPYSFSSLVLSE